ncbi:MAG TPA: flagellar basal body L-ring protein FlgH [Bryobacteraceae bacterium]|jgi:flagellar L-ring protein precursor FlgH|nr:flagellar basal body L-ring protein FlgH [Bryobacteraceae bacterium]
MKYFSIFFVTASLCAQNAASPGSLFIASGRLADSVRDVRAGVVDDIVTIVVSESLAAVASGATNSSRKSSAVSNINAAYGVLKAGARIANPLNISGDQELAGTGSTSRNMTLQTNISARVVDVLPNGNLVIEATREIAVNSEKQTITIHGMVRPADLTTNNVVTSNQVADLQVKVNGKGVVGDAIRRPHFLYRLLLGLLPF